MRGTFEVRGAKVRTQTIRRYIVVRVRPGHFLTTDVIRRTDSLTTARAHVDRLWRNDRVHSVIVDTTDGKEVN